MRSKLSAILIVCVALSQIHANEATRVFGIILGQAQTVNEQYSAAMNLVSLNDPASAEYVADALDRLLETRGSVKASSEKELYERLTRLYAKSLGDWRYSNASLSLWRVVKESADPLTRGEAIIALGGIRAQEFAERISLILADLNSQPTPDADAGEKLAYACVLSLESMKSPIGFPQVFFAADGWYSRRVKDQAERSLPLILPDPTDALLAIMDTEPTPRKIRALDLALRSSASRENKIKAAAYALHSAIINLPRDKSEGILLSGMRKGAMGGLIGLADKSGASAPDFKESYRIGDMDERLVALKAMGQDGSVASALVLSEIITTMNEEQRAGLTSEARNTLMKAAAQNAGINGKKELFMALQMVKANEKWSNGIITQASEALKLIK